MEILVIPMLIGLGWFVGWFVGFSISFILFVIGLILIYKIWDDFIGSLFGILIGIAITSNLISGYYYDDKSDDIIRTFFSSEQLDKHIKNNNIKEEPIKKVDDIPEDEEPLYDSIKEWLNSKPLNHYISNPTVEQK